jgi:predicted ATP-grasp superfamily ATP-dependent carboligase
VNPRLCTSYIGYRAVTKENLARRMLEPSDISIQWMPRSVQFSSDRLPDGVD